MQTYALKCCENIVILNMEFLHFQIGELIWVRFRANEMVCKTPPLDGATNTNDALHIVHW